MGAQRGKTMKMRMVLATMLMAFAGMANAQANTIPSQPHLLVKGQAERIVTPDRFTIEILLQATDMFPEQARRKVQDNAAMLLALLKRNDALPDSIHASSLSISPENAYENGKQVFKGTKVVRRIRGTFGDLDKARAVLADLNTSPDLQVMALRSGYSQAGKLRAELKREAAQQSRRTAEGLASAYNARIIGLYTISDVAPDFAYGVRAGTWDAIDDDGFAPSAPPAPASSPDIGVVVSGNRIAAESLEAGAISFTENVYAIFLISQ